MMRDKTPKNNNNNNNNNFDQLPAAEDENHSYFVQR